MLWLLSQKHLNLYAILSGILKNRPFRLLRQISRWKWTGRVASSAFIFRATHKGSKHGYPWSNHDFPLFFDGQDAFGTDSSFGMFSKSRPENNWHQHL